MRHPTWTGAASAVLVLVSAVGLAGCGDDSAATAGANGAGKGTTSAGASAPAADHNEADVAFASHMILHHQQALQMSGMAKWQATSAQVKQLAAAITTAQEAEMKQMSGWLTGWGEPVPAASHSGHAMEDEIPGMMTEDEMHELGKTKGSMFDRVWIQMMIKHHLGALTMAKAEQTGGRSPAATTLANRITTAQTAEIATLNRLLAQLPTA
ncbi:DUF305 domain-containing protein [Kribbella sindirgiensis]|uniref:DUF305 domain-containing protein n=2 Tax=Kribbella sindirgiensis TaxID=1124744 RepID=A0A4R0IHY7_9ACTN|nr:DUF305 domain-containing protein [Kribbella sindirgiensis]